METILYVTGTPAGPAERMLRSGGYDLVVRSFDDDVMQMLEDESYRVILFDFDRRETAEVEIIRMVRASHPTLVVVAIDNSCPDDANMRAIEGLNAGADEYFLYPFDLRLLSAKMGALFRRLSLIEDGDGMYHFGKFVLDYWGRTLDVGTDRPVKLTFREASMMKLLCLYRGRCLPRPVVLRALWYDDSYYNGRSMDVMVANLRKKLSPHGIVINTERSRGYVLLT